MAEVQWPASLQQSLNSESFNEKIGETVLRSENDIGPAKVRRRFTKSVDQITATINLTVAQYTTFKTFFKTGINGGATRFQFTHPISGETILVRFTEPPTFEAIGGVSFRASFNWEILP